MALVGGIKLDWKYLKSLFNSIKIKVHNIPTSLYYTKSYDKNNELFSRSIN